MDGYPGRVERLLDDLTTQKPWLLAIPAHTRLGTMARTISRDQSAGGTVGQANFGSGAGFWRGRWLFSAPGPNLGRFGLFGRFEQSTTSLGRLRERFAKGFPNGIGPSRRAG
jgi:hypothetical protein